MSELPSTWEICSLSDLMIDVIGGDWGVDPEEALVPSEICYVMRGTDFRDWEGKRAANAPRRRIKSSSVERRALCEGDIVVEISGGGPSQPVGRARLIDTKALRSVSGKLLCSNFFRRVQLHKELVPKYFALQMDYLSKTGSLNDYQTQTTNLRNLNFTDCSAAKIFSLPPVNEQKRIVAKLDELLPKVEACKQRLEKIPTILKRFRQSVLAAAVSGRLTEGWRMSNPHQNASALKLELVRQMANEKKPEIDAENEEWVSELREIVPPSWDVCRIGEVAKVMLGGTPSRKKPEYWNGDIPWISSGEVANCEIFDTEEKITSEGLDNSNAKLLSPGTVLVAMIGEGKTRGQSAILRVPATSNQNSASIVFDQALLLPEFVFFWMLYRYEATRSGGRGGNQPALNGEKVRQLPFILPPTDEQREIVRLIKSELASIEKLFLSVSNANAFIDRTADAILQRAFAGALVLQDPTDEPATLLLERIKSSASTSKQKRAPSGKRKAAKEPQSLSA